MSVLQHGVSSGKSGWRLYNGSHAGSGAGATGNAASTSSRAVLTAFKEWVLLQDSCKVLANTVLIKYYHIVIGSTFVIFVALMLNELKARWFKRVAQTAVYLPHFVSWVVMAGIFTTTGRAS